MSEEEIHLDVDPMLFYAIVIEDELALLDAMTNPIMGDMFSVTGFPEGMADIAREKAAEAQTALDALIEADKTWRPA
jgi:hypothetical protein